MDVDIRDHLKDTEYHGEEGEHDRETQDEQFEEETYFGGEVVEEFD